MWRAGVENDAMGTMAILITFEPLPAGNRQIEKGVSKARNPLQRAAIEVSLS
jgi:hypothetical protein